MSFANHIRTDDWLPGEFVVVDPLIYDAVNGERFIVPRGFITDFASVPKAVQLLPGFDVNGNSRRPAVLHDYLYCTHQLTRERSDDLLREALLSVGCGASLARTFWAGVRVGGWFYWTKRRDGIKNNFDFVPDSYWSNP